MPPAKSKNNNGTDNKIISLRDVKYLDRRNYGFIRRNGGLSEERNRM